jgi:hypothetical protein
MADNNRKERYLTKEETTRLLVVLKDSPNRVMADLITFLILTGARKSEASQARWENINLQTGVWTVPLSKSGKPRYIPLSKAAIALLEKRRTNGSEYVFASPKTGRPLIHLYSPWDKIRKQAGMDQAKKVWLKEVEALLGSLLTEQAGELQGVLQKMATQSNIAITALCEAADDIRTAVLNLDARLSRLENDLDMKEADSLELYQVKAGNYQVDLPKISMPAFLDQDQNLDPDDDLAPVRDSITNGIPDKEMLAEWIIARREEDLQANSYSALAAALNEAEVPTMSGRANWTRSTVRNLVVRKKAEQG